jgi:hypothetical protein
MCRLWLWRESIRMQAAVVYRGTARDAYAVQIQGWPGIVEIHCACVHTNVARTTFDKLVRSISPVDASSLVHVSVSVGRYCLAKRGFVDCELSFQNDHVHRKENWQPVVIPMIPLDTPGSVVARKKPRFISCTQNATN